MYTLTEHHFGRSQLLLCIFLNVWLGARWWVHQSHISINWQILSVVSTCLFNIFLTDVISDHTTNALFLYLYTIPIIYAFEGMYRFLSTFLIGYFIFYYQCCSTNICCSSFIEKNIYYRGSVLIVNKKSNKKKLKANDMDLRRLMI